jgi:hypothetical protein
MRVDAAADPVETPGDSQFLTQFPDLIADEGEVVELLLERDLFVLKPFEVLEEFLAVAFGSGELCVRSR